jgi:hypothetical protein
LTDRVFLDGLLLTRDLMFTSKVTGTASALGLKFETLGSVEHLWTKVVESQPRAVFVDLGCLDCSPLVVMEYLNFQSRPTVIGFGSHVDVERLESARAAGFDKVLPRSKFSASLPELLRETFGLTA